jgi:hypothetical protein
VGLDGGEAQANALTTDPHLPSIPVHAAAARAELAFSIPEEKVFGDFEFGHGIALSQDLYSVPVHADRHHYK